MANEDNKIDADDTQKAIESIRVNHQNLMPASNGLLALAKQVGFIDESGFPIIKDNLDSDDLTKDQNTFIDYVLALDLSELMAETDQIIAAADNLAPHVLTNNVPIAEPVTSAAESQALSEKTLKSILALDSPLGFVEEAGRSGLVRNQAEIDIVDKFLKNNEGKEGAWPVKLINYYQAERRVYNSLQALQKQRVIIKKLLDK